MSKKNNATPSLSCRLLAWVDDRFPATKMWKEHLSEYYAPKNFNIWYFFGSLALLVLVNQILTGIWLTMDYNPTAAGAFESVEGAIMRDRPWGWLLRYMHAVGASLFFVVVYLHMFRGVLYGSYKKPRELIWLFGMFIFLCLMAEAFFGYLLPWGQMSFWGAQVIVSLFGAIPYVGEDLAQWVRGDYIISGATLNRFFALHVIAIPLCLVALVVLHILALHQVGSNNPDGVEIKDNKKDGIPVDGIPFHPYYTVKDLVGVAVFLFVFCFILFFTPEMGGYFLEHANFIQANPMQTPEHIAPVWYFTPFYSMLRAVPDKLFGVITMASAVAVLFILPWLDRSPVKSIRYKGNWSKFFLALFVVCFVVLGYLGTEPPTAIKTVIAQLATLGYFSFFLLMPFYTRHEKTKLVPKRLTK